MENVMEDGKEVDAEMSMPPQKVMQSEAEHLACPEKYTTATFGVKEEDQLYSKCICYKCGLGEVLGDIVCGGNEFFICFAEEGTCGLGGEGGCPKGSATCEMFSPVFDCGANSKCLCLKYGCVAPWKEGAPWLVCCKKTIIGGSHKRQVSS